MAVWSSNTKACIDSPAEPRRTPHPGTRLWASWIDMNFLLIGFQQAWRAHIERDMG
jgi:hypothetical protein